MWNDMSLAQSLNLKNCMIDNPDPNHARRTHHLLPPDACELQEQLNNLQEYCRRNEMVINQNKTKVMLFNTARIYDGMPKLTLSDMGGDYLDVVETFKLL
jgi:hypothetical protein